MGDHVTSEEPRDYNWYPGAPDSGTTDVSLRRLQAFSVPIGSTVQWVNERNSIIAQQGSFTYNGDLITIPAVKVFKMSSRLKVSYIITGVAEQQSIPHEYRLAQNYPNPFNPGTTIQYVLPHRSHVILSVHNTLGQQVATLVQSQQEAGAYGVNFDGSALASGVYFYRFQTGSFVDT